VHCRTAEVNESDKYNDFGISTKSGEQRPCKLKIKCGDEEA